MDRLRIATTVIVIFIAFSIQAQTTAISGAGLIESTVGGFKFPDGTIQTTAATSPAGCIGITSLPYVISNEGVYCFTGNLSTAATSGNAISILSDNVVIYLNGWKLDGTSAGIASAAIGIHANGRKNITIRNGTVRGFFHGIFIDGMGGHLVEDVHLDNNITIGIFVNGDGSIVRRNQVLDTKGIGCCIEFNTQGIVVYGDGVRALDNDIYNTTTQQALVHAYGLSFLGSGIVAENNRIHNVTGPGPTIGLLLLGSDDALVRGNSISSSDKGIDFVGFTGDPLSTGKYMDNLTANVTIPFVGGTPVGDNN